MEVSHAKWSFRYLRPNSYFTSKLTSKYGVFQSQFWGPLKNVISNNFTE